MTAPKTLPRHYSGLRSRAFWKLVNERDRDMDVYLAAVLLQEMEERVLRWVETKERKSS
jgi:hypothetical protein